MTDFDKITIATALGRAPMIHQLSLSDSFSGTCCPNFILAFRAPEFIMVTPFALVAPTIRIWEDADIA